MHPARDDLRRLCEDLARRAGALALDGRRSLDTDDRVAHETKSSPTDPVTEFDRAAEALIVAEIRRARPLDSIVGEEGTDHVGTSAMAWHIDPIDGTVNFVYGLPGWCTSVAVADDAGWLAGAVFVPTAGELFSAGRGSGATVNGRPLHCSNAADLSTALVATGFNYAREARALQGARLAALLPLVRDVRRSGSAAFDLCTVAAGRVDAYYEEHLNSWDLAAGVLIATEAGATTSDFHGGEAGTEATVAAAPGVHQALCETIRRIDSGSASTPAD